MHHKNLLNFFFFTGPSITYLEEELKMTSESQAWLELKRFKRFDLFYGKLRTLFLLRIRIIRSILDSDLHGVYGPRSRRKTQK